MSLPPQFKFESVTLTLLKIKLVAVFKFNFDIFTSVKDHHQVPQGSPVSTQRFQQSSPDTTGKVDLNHRNERIN